MNFDRGKYIRKLRETHFGRKITREKLAEMVDSTAATVARWESNATEIKTENLERLAEVFGVPLSSFFGGPSEEDVEEIRNEKDAEINALKAKLYDLSEQLERLQATQQAGRGGPPIPGGSIDPDTQIIISDVVRVFSQLDKKTAEHFRNILKNTVELMKSTGPTPSALKKCRRQRFQAGQA